MSLETNVLNVLLLILLSVFPPLFFSTKVYARLISFLISVLAPTNRKIENILQMNDPPVQVSLILNVMKGIIPWFLLFLSTFILSTFSSTLGIVNVDWQYVLMSQSVVLLYLTQMNIRSWKGSFGDFGFGTASVIEGIFFAIFYLRTWLDFFVMQTWNWDIFFLIILMFFLYPTYIGVLVLAIFVKQRVDDFLDYLPAPPGRKSKSVTGIDIWSGENSIISVLERIILIICLGIITGIEIILLPLTLIIAPLSYIYSIVLSTELIVGALFLISTGLIYIATTRLKFQDSYSLNIISFLDGLGIYQNADDKMYVLLDKVLRDIMIEPTKKEMPKLAARFQSLNKDELREFAYHHLPAEKWCAVEEICHLGNGDGYIVYRPRKTDTDIQRLSMFKRKEKKGKVYYYFIAKDVRAVRKELAKKMGIVEDTYKQELERKIQKSLRKNKIDYSSLGLDN